MPEAIWRNITIEDVVIMAWLVLGNPIKKIKSRLISGEMDDMVLGGYIK